MIAINPIDLFLWTFRRNERDVIKLYSSLSDLMRLATGGDMLNFGYWEDGSSPASAQQKLCTVFADMAQLSQNQTVLDAGSGYGAPAIQWESAHGPLDMVSLNTNYSQLKGSPSGASRVNATATVFPFGDSSVDRVLAFESAQHFKPLSSFLCESWRVLKDDGILALAIPVMAQDIRASAFNLGLLYLTWSSEHYSENHLLSMLDAKFKTVSIQRMGNRVYAPLADYYEKNRQSIRKNILNSYPGYVEGILYRSVKKMKSVYEDKTIEYLLISCKKRT